MKVCSRCKRLLSEDNFGKDKNTKNGLNYYCRDCRRELHIQNEIRKQHKIEREKYADATGGIKIYILNHPCRGEKKFNICSTDEWFYNTDDREDFLNYLTTRI